MTPLASKAQTASDASPTEMLAEAIGRTLDAAVFFGTNDPRLAHRVGDTMADTVAAIERLNVAAIQYKDASEDRDGAMAYLKRAVREADEAGVPRRKIAQLAGISPQTVYDTLREGQL